MGCSKEEQMVLKKAKDHWAFLEEIEAPMWVDLTTEANCYSQDKDDDWLHTNHPFHQCSSRQLKSMLLCSGEETVTSEFDSVEASSPKIPSSVSRSRGKDYRSKKWKADNRDTSLNKQHSFKVLMGKSSCVDSGSRKEIKPKLSFINPKGASCSNTSLVTGRSLAGNAKANHVKQISTCGDSESCLSSVVVKAGVSSTTSTVTSENNKQQQKKFLEVSSRALGTSSSGILSAVTSEINQQQQKKLLEVSSRALGTSSSGLLSAVKISLRKSCGTRPASRVEINNRGRPSTVEISNDSRKSKSSSGKSSVGSSSNPGYDFKGSTFASIRKERTPDSRNVARMTDAEKSRVKVPTVSKASTIEVNKGTYNSRKGAISNVAKATHLAAAKSKAQSQSFRAKPLLRLIEQNSCSDGTKAKVKVQGNRLNRPVAVGKENTAGRMPISQKCSGREHVSRGTIGGKKGTKQDVPQKGDRTRLAGPKGKISDRSEGRSSSDVSQRAYFR